MTNYRYLGYGVTDSNGVAHLDHDAQGQEIEHSYTGVGAGEVDVLASLDNPITSGSIVSETYSVEDAIYTEMVNGVEKPFYKANTNTSVNDGVRTLTATGWSDWMPSTTIYASNVVYFTIPFKVKINITDLSDDFVYALKSENGTEAWGKYCSQTGLYEFIVETGKCTVKVDGTEIASYNTTNANIADNSRFKISMNATDKTLSYKDCRIYPI